MNGLTRPSEKRRAASGASTSIAKPPTEPQAMAELMTSVLCWTTQGLGARNDAADSHWSASIVGELVTASNDIVIP